MNPEAEKKTGTLTHSSKAGVADTHDETSRLGTLLSGLIDVMDIAMWELDLNYRVVSLNRKAEEIYGGNIKGDFCYHVAEGTETICSNCPAKKVYSGDTSGRSEHKRIDIHGNTIYVDHIATPIRDKDDNLTGVLVSIIDITKHKLTNEELRQANKKLIEQQKTVVEKERLRIMLQLASAAAQELILPLNVLIRNIQLLKLGKDNDQKLDQNIEQIEDIGGQLTDVAQKLNGISLYQTASDLSDPDMSNPDKKIHVLSVEDSYIGFSTIKAILQKNDRFTLEWTRNIEKAFNVLGKEKFDLILLDYMLPDGNGLDFLKRLNNKGIEIPVIAITGKGDEIIASKFIREGAYDYMSKEMMNKETLLKSIDNTLETFRIKKEIKSAQKIMVAMATRDDLTKLYNRRYFFDVFERDLARTKRYDSELVLALLDVDQFKNINDTYGHEAGDKVLVDLGWMIKESVRESDLPCRYAGEEFAIILNNIDAGMAKKVCERFKNRVADYEFTFNKSSFHATVSIGIVAYNSTEERTTRELINAADQALYQAKSEGGNKVVEFAIVF